MKTCGECIFSGPLEPHNEHDVPSKRKCLNCNWHLHNPTPVHCYYSISFVYADDNMPCPCFKDKVKDENSQKLFS